MPTRYDSKHILFMVLKMVVQNIMNSLTTKNVPYEMFSKFSALWVVRHRLRGRDELTLCCSFEDMRKASTGFNVGLIEIFNDISVRLQAEIDFFLKHWNEIRSSSGMAAVWQQIRDGRHPGFEEGKSSCRTHGRSVNFSQYGHALQ